MRDIREGDLHKIVIIGENVFEIRYGYTSEEERNRWEPVPIYPDFVSKPEYTKEGLPFATVYQDGCHHFRAKPLAFEERWCGDCRYFEKCEDYIGVCRYADKKDNPELRTPSASAELAET